MSKKLNIAFYWHMHQPLYKDPFTNEYVLPWVALHATKDYYDMVSILEEFPQIHQTFNMVPSLVDQLADYTSGTVLDRLTIITAKRPADLSFDEKRFILERFFQANWHCMIRPFPRLWELLLKRGFSAVKEDITNAVRYFKDQDFLDLQVLFNLAWIDPQIVRTDSDLLRLKEKGKNYSEQDKELLLRKQYEIVTQVIPLYRSLMEEGSIELTTSPYFHPIMPLLCDTSCAREAEPNISLPQRPFVHPEDALAQLKMGIERHVEAFGKAPKGMWPSEGSVSMETLKLISEVGIEWVATDEEILVHSLGRSITRDENGNSNDSFLYRPYRVDMDGRGVDMVFRDHILSDLIGFDYAKWDPQKAADNLITRLVHIADMVDDPGEHMVSIILDGENAWETYSNDGRDFLFDLYTKLTDHDRLQCVTVGEFLSGSTNKEAIERVFAGSWISHNFRVWIGDLEVNDAWDLLSEARDALEKAESVGSVNGVEGVDFKAAWHALYAAQGSDWFWWYGDIHSSENDEVFDHLFRLYLKKVYLSAGLALPSSIEVPIIGEEKGVRPEIKPTKFIDPVIDGEITSYFEWYSAGLIKRTGSGGAMHSSSEWQGLLSSISYGFNLEKIFFRLDHLNELKPYTENWSFALYIEQRRRLKIHVSVFEGQYSVGTLFERTGDDTEWLKTGGYEDVAAVDVVEIAVPFNLLGAEVGDEIFFFFEVDSGERGFERWPIKGHLISKRPGKDFDLEDWSV